MAGNLALVHGRSPEPERGAGYLGLKLRGIVDKADPAAQKIYAFK